MKKKPNPKCSKCHGTGLYYLESSGYHEGITIGGNVSCPCIK